MISADVFICLFNHNAEKAYLLDVVGHFYWLANILRCNTWLRVLKLDSLPSVIVFIDDEFHK